MAGACGAGDGPLSEATEGTAAPLEIVARQFDVPGVHWLVAIGVMTAMLGVLLNLIMGLSRVVLAMGRRSDLPDATARLNASGTTPYVAVIVVGVIITDWATIGSVKTTWAFSAFTVLIYYAITNFAALRLKKGRPPLLAALCVGWLGGMPVPGLLSGLADLAHRTGPDCCRPAVAHDAATHR